MSNLENDIPKHRKRKQSSTSKSKNKADHKHEYKEVFFEYINSVGKPDISRGTRCKICGKISDVILFETERMENGGYRMLKNEEVYEKYKDLEKIHIDNIWQNFAPLEGGE